MKRILVLAFFFTISQVAFAQFEEVKTLLTLSQFAKAKDALDLLEKKPKVVVKPEFYIARATVLSNIIRNSGTTDISKMRDNAIADYRKYLAMDPSKALMTDAQYSAAPINFYVSYFGESVDLFNKKNWAKAAPSLKVTIEWSDFIIDNKIATLAFDTTANLLAGVAYQNDNNEEEASKYYKRLAEKNVGGQDNDIVYRFLMNYYFTKDDVAGFEKMRKAGLELYPKIQYFTYSDLDFILEMEDEGKKFKKIEEKISREPNNIDVIQTYGFLLFNKLNADSATEKVPNYEAEEVKMTEMLAKAGEGKPDEGTSFFYAGSHYWNKALRVKDQIGLVNDTVRIFNASVKPDKTGKTPPPPKALTDRRDNLRKLQEMNVDKALPFLLKSVPGIEKSSAKGKTEMQTYKRLVDQLIEIYSNKRQLAKLPADKAKFEAEEKKWDALYAKITEK
jgi:hypothetical protein